MFNNELWEELETITVSKEKKEKMSITIEDMIYVNVIGLIYVLFFCLALWLGMGDCYCF